MKDCCQASHSATAPPTRTGVLAAGGALLSAVASSACCWLPLSLLVFGASATGLSAWFERYRLPFLTAAGLLLAFSYYSVYFRAGQCEPDSACTTAKPRSLRFTKAMLWISTVFIVAFAAFPKYVGALLPDDRPAASESVNTRTVLYTIEGMTCEACAVTLSEKLRKVDGVQTASVSYSDRSATVVFENSAPDAPAFVDEAIDALGYSIVEVTTGPISENDLLPSE